MRVTIVTPWRGKRAEFERDYWQAVRLVTAEVLIVDDGSDPPLPNGIRIPRSGFARACNEGLRAARTDVVVFLNNDIAAAGDWLSPLVSLLEEGVLVGAQLRSDPHAAVDGLAFPYLDGWCLAGMRKELLDLGGWDESFDEPAYYGDNDLCLRARLAGMTLRESSETARLLIHKGNGTAGPPTDPVVRQATAANRKLFLARAREALEVCA